VVTAILAFVELARVAAMEDTGTVETLVRTVAEIPVVTGSEVRIRMRAHPDRVADVVGTLVAVVSAGRCGRGQTIVGFLVAGIIAVAAAGAGGTGVVRARTGRASVGAVAEETVAAGCIVGRRRAGIGTAVVIVRVAVVAFFAGGHDAITAGGEGT